MTETQKISHKPDQHDDEKTPALITAPALLIRITSTIDTISIGSGKLVALLIVPMILSLVYEVACRYLFSAPTIWASDMSTLLYGGFFMLGAAYALQRQQHIRTDFLYEKWSTRTKGIVDSILYILLYFPGLGIFLWIGWQYAWRSILQQERIVSSPWMPYIWPLKLTIPISTALLLSQGVSELIKSLYAAVSGLDLHGSTESIET
ncbi:MAG: TRAP transporter small permease subunit [Deltaproteobacteria bacterium]|nr:TRAP transporter small permease subunit [Deltaproteobacteria bacterium]MBW2307826.1 TRAP transporter small permease subunit [Deltaproteobacteria bacterium]